MTLIETELNWDFLKDAFPCIMGTGHPCYNVADCCRNGCVVERGSQEPQEQEATPPQEQKKENE